MSKRSVLDHNFVIQDDVPLPAVERTKYLHGNYKAAIKELHVNQSVFIPNKTPELLRASVRNIKSQFSLWLNYTYETRLRYENGAVGTRIWRTT